MRLSRRLFEPVDGASLAAFRVLFGLLMFAEAAWSLSGGWLDDEFVRPAFHFTYLGFGWVHPPSAAGLRVLFAALGAAALGAASGALYRLSASVLTLGWAYYFLLDESNYFNHYYLLLILSGLLLASPAHRLWSVDALRSPRWSRERVPAWPLLALRGQVVLVYLFAAAAKLDSDWLSGLPMSLWMARESDLPLLGAWLSRGWAVHLLSWGGLLFDLLAPALLLARRTRLLGVVLSVLFHGANLVLFHIGFFPIFMLAATTLFLEPGWPRRLLRRPLAPAAPALSPAPASKRLTAAALAAHFSLQVLLPLRHWLIPGDVAWTYEGHRFSWRMMLSDRRFGELGILLVDRATGGSSWVNPRRYLSRRQLAEMATHPDMLRQFCAFVARRNLRQGRAVSVYALATVSLNGRPPALLVDPTVDLGAEPAALGHAPWILAEDDPSAPQKRAAFFGRAPEAGVLRPGDWQRASRAAGPASPWPGP